MFARHTNAHGSVAMGVCLSFWPAAKCAASELLCRALLQCGARCCFSDAAQAAADRAGGLPGGRDHCNASRRPAPGCASIRAYVSRYGIPVGLVLTSAAYSDVGGEKSACRISRGRPEGAVQL